MPFSPFPYASGHLGTSGIVGPNQLQWVQGNTPGVPVPAAGGVSAPPLGGAQGRSRGRVLSPSPSDTSEDPGPPRKSRRSGRRASARDDTLERLVAVLSTLARDRDPRPGGESDQGGAPLLFRVPRRRPRGRIAGMRVPTVRRVPPRLRAPRCWNPPLPPSTERIRTLLLDWTLPLRSMRLMSFPTTVRRRPSPPRSPPGTRRPTSPAHRGILPLRPRPPPWDRHLRQALPLRRVVTILFRLP